MIRLSKANEFLIWREAQSVKWDCTANDLAQATGLGLTTVKRHIRQNGWSERLPKPENHGGERKVPVRSVDAMTSPLTTKRNRRMIAKRGRTAWLTS